jgi:hypothetical protein
MLRRIQQFHQTRHLSDTRFRQSVRVIFWCREMGCPIPNSKDVIIMFGSTNSALKTDKFEQQVLGALLCCAVGDAIGAGIENWSLADIIARFGQNREVEYHRYIRPNKPKTNGAPGDVTDDTSMTACVMAALTKTMKEFLKNKDFSANDTSEFLQKSLQNMFQAFLFWAQSSRVATVIQ